MVNYKNFKGWPHLTLSGFNCKGLGKKRLNDLDFIYDFLYELPEKIGMQRLGTPHVEKVSNKRHVDPGISGTVMIFTSHVALHTFTKGQKNGLRKPRNVNHKIFTPFFTADVYSCKEFDIEETIAQFLNAFTPSIIEKHIIYRLREDEDLVEVEPIHI